MFHCHGWIRIQIDLGKIEHHDPESDEFDQLRLRRLDEYITVILDEIKRIQENTSLLQYTHTKTQIGDYLHIFLDKNRKSLYLKNFYTFVASLNEASYGILYEMDLDNCEDYYPFVTYKLMGSTFEECPETLFNGNFNGMIDY